MPVTVLLAADGRDCWQEVDSAMRTLGLSVRRAESGKEALRLHDRVAPGLVLVATDLGDVHALDVCRRLRRSSDVPLIVLASEADDFDRVLALELGADDVVSGGCASEELQERVRAALRRGSDVTIEQSPEDTLDFGRIRIDRRSNLLMVDDDERELTPMECDLMWALAESAGEVVRSEHLLQTVWGYPPGVKTRTLDVHIGRLRKKLGEDGRNPRHIITVRSVGYRFEPEPEREL